jgi:hypothetical protein
MFRNSSTVHLQVPRRPFPPQLLPQPQPQPPLLLLLLLLTVRVPVAAAALRATCSATSTSTNPNPHRSPSQHQRQRLGQARLLPISSNTPPVPWAHLERVVLALLPLSSRQLQQQWRQRSILKCCGYGHC